MEGSYQCSKQSVAIRTKPIGCEASVSLSLVRRAPLSLFNTKAFTHKLPQQTISIQLFVHSPLMSCSSLFSGGFILF